MLYAIRHLRIDFSQKIRSNGGMRDLLNAAGTTICIFLMVIGIYCLVIHIEDFLTR